MAYQECESLEPLGSIDDEIGEIRSFMRNSAPRGWLICDGSSYSTDAYPKLVNLFIQEFGTAYKFGGSGGTFNVPDLRGEFLRGTGTNSHTNQGNGSNVGVHQDATRQLRLEWNNSENGMYIDNAPTGTSFLSNPDRTYAQNGAATGRRFASSSSWPASAASANAYTARPTNTSVLYCIRAY